MDEEFKTRIDALEQKIDATFRSAEKTRKYFLAVIVISAIAFVLPLLGIIFVMPSFMGTYTQLGELLQ